MYTYPGTSRGACSVPNLISYHLSYQRTSKCMGYCILGATGRTYGLAWCSAFSHARKPYLILHGSMPPVNIQALRGDGCQEEKCALCANGDSPCQSCLLGNPSADVCDDPNSRIFWDSLHLTTAFHQLFAEAVRQCAKDTPDTCHPWVETLCPTL